ncbi:alpha/beta hydrolase [Zunongwangia endophytica]|uniref:Alpha/beta hydrolase n=1 Tax=Zunongwangia endophytica TaxID=1808945 RepID=A0ABV8H9L4_9FLAO|nr:alpha/beta hydrolase [Zunongwangia endophytica]MDN3593715.1 alpha/beta hydrolase [Zunongwangia endophytica]
MKKYFFIGILLLNLAPLFAQQLEDISLNKLDKYIATQESKIEDLKPDNEAHIIWENKYQKTPIAIVYLHGFGASSREGEPVVSKLAEKFGWNVYMSRLQSHGIDSKDAFKSLTPENYIASAQEALAIGKKIGEKVLLVSTSTGGTLSLILASEEKDLAGVIMYSPFIGLKNPAMAAITQPGGKEFFINQIGGEVQYQDRPAEEAKYWSTDYHVNGYIGLIKMLQQNMKPETFSKVTCPVFLGYYYKNEEEQDQVVSVPAMLKMYAELGTPDAKKEKVAFPEAGNHVIASDLRSNDWENVYKESVEFITEKIK